MAKTPPVKYEGYDTGYNSGPSITAGGSGGFGPATGSLTYTGSGGYIYPPMRPPTSSQFVDAFLDAELIPCKGGFMLQMGQQVTFIPQEGKYGEAVYSTGMQSIGKLRDILNYLSEKSLEK